MPKYKLRPYQQQIFDNIRNAFRENRAVLAESGTGSGKSIIMSAIVDSFLSVNKKWNKDRHVYFLVDENFLLYQFSNHLENMHIPHDLITSGKKEGRPVNVHVATIQSLRRHHPKNEPSLFIVDEAHFSTSPSFMDLFEKYPDAKILGFTASPETGAGKGLSLESGNGIFDIMVESPVSMRELTEGIEITDECGVTTLEKYLVPIRYFGVPIKGIENLHIRTGDYKNDEVEKLLKQRGTFGDSINEMRKFPHIENHILYFCKSVKACYDMEVILNSNGYTTAVLEGSLTKTQRKKIMKDFASGKAQILVTCRMVLKGVDIPKLSMAVDLAPTPSRGTLRQKIGRGTRKAEGKDEFIYLDMVGNHRCLPGSDIYAKIDWNFNSKGYNKKPTGTGEENVCPVCYALIPIGKTQCVECGAAKPKAKPKKEKHLDGELVEIVPVPLKERTEEDKKDVTRKIHAAVQDNNIKDLYDIGLTVTSKKKVPLWIYYKLRKTENVIDVPLLYRIQRQLKYKPSWVFFMKKQIRN